MPKLELPRINIHWFRRDLRFKDNHSLYKALTSDLPVLGVFIFDQNILTKLKVPEDKRVQFIFDEITKMRQHLNQEYGSDLKVYYGRPEEIWLQILREFSIKSVFANRDYEPYAIDRDQAIGRLLKKQGVDFFLFKDQVIFEQNEVCKADKTPYTVYTPYSKKWKSCLKITKNQALQAFPSEDYLHKFAKLPQESSVKWENLGFKRLHVVYPEKKVLRKKILSYGEDRDYPYLEATSQLGIHLRFGTVSIRKVVAVALSYSAVWLNELIWREFFMMILYHFPYVENEPFKKKWNQVPWRQDREDFTKWCEGLTGYPLVDAGMRELKATGYMHNRVRMLTASFLTKHLLIDWRWGERYFAAYLLDFELASNVGNWQWAAGCGCDAAPYFRIFNPEIQAKKFDPERIYQKKWVPELDSSSYPQPMVDHRKSVARAQRVFAESLR